MSLIRLVLTRLGLRTLGGPISAAVFSGVQGLGLIPCGLSVPGLACRFMRRHMLGPAQLPGEVHSHSSLCW